MVFNLLEPCFRASFLLYGWAGMKPTCCFVLVDDCSDDPCLNGGKCIINNFDRECKCEPGLGGALCEKSKFEIPVQIPHSWVIKELKYVEIVRIIKQMCMLYI